MGVDDFLLGRNFLRAYHVLVDVTSMKMVVRAPVQPVWHHTHTQVGDPAVAVPVALDHDSVLQPFEGTVVKAKVVNDDLEPLIVQNVVLNTSIADASLQNVVFLEDCVVAISGAGNLFITVINLPANLSWCAEVQVWAPLYPWRSCTVPFHNKCLTLVKKTKVTNDHFDSSVCIPSFKHMY